MIIHKYDEKIENIKKEHELEITKRKYSYESKKEQYYKFMDKLDSFNIYQLDLLQTELGPIVRAFYESKVVQEQERHTINFNRKALELTSNLRSKTAGLFSQFNSLKLSANLKIIQLLEELQNSIQESNIPLEKAITCILSQEFQQTGWISDKYI
jgi:hypothetical protein